MFSKRTCLFSIDVPFPSFFFFFKFERPGLGCGLSTGFYGYSWTQSEPFPFNCSYCFRPVTGSGMYTFQAKYSFFLEYFWGEFNLSFLSYLFSNYLSVSFYLCIEDEEVKNKMKAMNIAWMLMLLVRKDLKSTSVYRGTDIILIICSWNNIALLQIDYISQMG